MKIEITVSVEGNLQVTSDCFDNYVFSLGMLEAAKQQLHNYTEKKLAGSTILNPHTGAPA